jgi:hypothetical protein
MKDINLRKLIKEETGIECDWKFTRQDEFINVDDGICRIRDYNDNSPITHNLYLSAINVSLKYNKGSWGLFEKRFVISFSLAKRLADLLIKDGILIYHPEYHDYASPCDVDRNLGEKLIKL